MSDYEFKIGDTGYTAGHTEYKVIYDIRDGTTFALIVLVKAATGVWFPYKFCTTGRCLTNNYRLMPPKKNLWHVRTTSRKRNFPGYESMRKEFSIVSTVFESKTEATKYASRMRAWYDNVIVSEEEEK